MMYKPIYLFGYNHGGTTTFLTMIREHSQIYCVSDLGEHPIRRDGRRGIEGHVAFFEHLPTPLKSPETLAYGYGNGVGWTYGWDETAEDLHQTEKDVKPEEREQFLTFMEKVKEIIGASDNMRWFDKSNPYVLKTRYIQEIISPADVYFIYLIRNPFLLCYKPLIYNLYNRLGLYVKNPKTEYDVAICDFYRPSDQRRTTQLRIKDSADVVRKACEHVSNNYRIFMQDSRRLKHTKVVRFEDLILDTRDTLKGVCDFLGLDFEENMMPHPISDTHQSRFYPLRKETVADDGIKNHYANPELDGIIADKCADIIDKFDYCTLA